MADVEPLDLDILDRIGAPVHAFEAGTKVFLQQDDGKTMFVVRTGRVDVITYDSVLENIRPGGVFGEMALIDDQPRSAAAVAALPTTVSAVDKATFLTLVRADPEFALHIMRLLSARIRRMNEQM